jgi:transposase
MYFIAMEITEFYSKILELSAPWEVLNVELHQEDKEVLVEVGINANHSCHCPICGSVSPRYDKNPKRWRDKDTNQFKTIIIADVPRVKCNEHGVRTISIPWAEKGSRYTYLFESYVIDWLKETSISAVCRQISIGYDAIWGIKARAVKRGLSRRSELIPKSVAIDETNSKKGHNYLTIISEGNRVLHVSEGRKITSLDEFWKLLSIKACEGVESVSMDLWQAFRSSTMKYVPNAVEKICLDRFHVAGYFGTALDKVRKTENRELLKDGNCSLVGMKYQLLKSDLLADNRTSIRKKFHQMINSCLKSSKAWAMKELQHKLWRFSYMAVAKRHWDKLLSWMQRSRIKPMVELAKSIRKHLWMILNAIRLGVSNGCAEGNNSRIQKVKKIACGFRNMDNFKNAIYFHLGELDMHPRP